MFSYTSERGYQYKQVAGGRVVRISAEPKAVTSARPNPGDYVRVIIKPYKLRKYVVGKIARVLTRKKMHSRGFKVMLEDGTVGRMITFD
jgi:uncharacterized repeat protein (TIGR03833 family)